MHVKMHLVHLVHLTKKTIQSNIISLTLVKGLTKTEPRKQEYNMDSQLNPRTSFTPGKWSVGVYHTTETMLERLKAGPQSCVCLDEDGKPGMVIALTGDAHDLQSQRDADLIAAAPSMFRVLENICASAPITGLPLALEKDIQAACNLLTKLRGLT